MVKPQTLLYNMPFARRQFFPCGVRHQNTNTTHGIPNTAKAINAPILNYFFFVKNNPANNAKTENKIPTP